MDEDTVTVLETRRRTKLPGLVATASERFPRMKERDNQAPVRLQVVPDPGKRDGDFDQMLEG